MSPACCNDEWQHGHDYDSFQTAVCSSISGSDYPLPLSDFFSPRMFQPGHLYFPPRQSCSSNFHFQPFELNLIRRNHSICEIQPPLFSSRSTNYYLLVDLRRKSFSKQSTLHSCSVILNSLTTAKSFRCSSSSFILLVLRDPGNHSGQYPSKSYTYAVRCTLHRAYLFLPHDLHSPGLELDLLEPCCLPPSTKIISCALAQASLF